MKRIIIILSIFILGSLVSFAQGRKHHQGMEKIEKLEKIKLVEILDVDDETMLKFFNRRDEHKDRIRQLTQDLEQNNQKIEVYLKAGKPVTDKELKELIDKNFDLEQKMVRERKEFFTSLTDILSYTQIAKLVVFQKNFREDVRGMIMKQRMR